MKKLLLSLIIALVSIGFIQADCQEGTHLESYECFNGKICYSCIENSNEMVIPAGNIQTNLQKYPVENSGIITNNEKETKPIKVCDKEDATLLEKLTCADDVKSSYLHLILTQLIIRQNNLIEELNETKNELKNIREELKNLEDIVGIRNGSQVISGTNILTGKSISEETKSENLSQIEDNQDTENNKGILGFFRKFLIKFKKN